MLFCVGIVEINVNFEGVFQKVCYELYKNTHLFALNTSPLGSLNGSVIAGWPTEESVAYFEAHIWKPAFEVVTKPFEKNPCGTSPSFDFPSVCHFDALLCNDLVP